MTDEERAIVKDGGIPDDWAAKPARQVQKDRDARWTLKRGRRKKGPDGKLMAEIATPIVGYKSHIGIDRQHGFIRTWSTSDAARYDGRELTGLIDPANTGSSIWADTAYRSQKDERAILRAGRVSKIHFRRAPSSRFRLNASAPMPPDRRCALPSNTCSRRRNTDGAFHPHHRNRAGQGQDWPRQHRVQLQAFPLLGKPTEHGMMGARADTATAPFR